MTAQLPAEKRFSPEILQAVGLLFVTAAGCEMALTFEMMRLVCHPHPFDSRATVALHGGEIRVKLRQIETLATLKLTVPHRDAVITACEKLKDAFERRNEFAHYVASPGQEKDRVILRTIKQSKGKIQAEKSYKIENIREVCATMNRLMGVIKTTLNEAGIKIPLERPKSGSPPPAA